MERHQPHESGKLQPQRVRTIERTRAKAVSSDRRRVLRSEQKEKGPLGSTVTWNLRGVHGSELVACNLRLKNNENHGARRGRSTLFVPVTRPCEATCRPTRPSACAFFYVSAHRVPGPCVTRSPLGDSACGKRKHLRLGCNMMEVNNLRVSRTSSDAGAGLHVRF